MNLTNKKHKLYLIFSYTGTMFSKILRIATRNKYVHVSIAFDDKLKEVYSFGRKEPKKIFPAGFVKEDYKSITEFFKNAECLIYEIEVDYTTVRKMKKDIKKYIIEQEKYQYDIIGLPLIFFRVPYKRRYHRVCSQFVGKLFQDNGIYDFNRHYSLIEPNHFYKIENKQFLYQGKLSNYINTINT